MTQDLIAFYFFGLDDFCLFGFTYRFSFLNFADHVHHFSKTNSSIQEPSQRPLQPTLKINHLHQVYFLFCDFLYWRVSQETLQIKEEVLPFNFPLKIAGSSAEAVKLEGQKEVF